MPTFAFPQAPQTLKGLLRRRRNALLPRPDHKSVYHGFGAVLDARLLSVPRPLDQ